ncbi:MAG: universal stress protein [Prochlorotrichaceae cyanobacterium]
MLISPDHRVLLPTDFSEPALRVQEEVFNCVPNPQQLHLLHVLLPLQTMDPGAIWQTVSDRERIVHAQESFQQRFAEDDRYQGIHFEVVVGNPSIKIVDYAKERSIDLIVIASHGRTGLARFLLGSVTERVVRAAPCSVLVWRG